MSGNWQRNEGLRPMPLSFVDWSGGKGIPEESSFDWAGAYSRYIEAYVGGRFANGLSLPDGVYVDCGPGMDGNNSLESGRRDRHVVGASGVGPVGNLRFGAFPTCDSVFDRLHCRPRDGDAIRLVNEGLSLGAAYSGCVAAGTKGGFGEGDAVLREEVGREDSCASVVIDVSGDSDVGVGDRFGDLPVKGKNYYSNRRKREQRKKRAKAERMLGSWRSGRTGENQNVPTLREFVEDRAESEIFGERAKAVEERIADESAFQRAKRTLAERWAEENVLAAEKAKRSLEILRAQDLQAEIKKHSTGLRLQTERNMVGMEKAHQFLKRTGNVPGFAQTVVSDEGMTDGSSALPGQVGDCTISPDSSASMKDFRNLMKKCADQEEKLAKFHKMTKIHPDHIDKYGKDTWTINSENIRILDEMYPQGHALNPIPDYENYDAPTRGELIVGRDEEYFPF